VGCGGKIQIFCFENQIILGFCAAWGGAQAAFKAAPKLCGVAERGLLLDVPIGWGGVAWAGVFFCFFTKIWW
jgi:hypothetical protein